MGLDYQRFDEAPAARAVARMFATDHHEERVTPQITALLPDLVAALDEPSDPLSLCTWLLARFTRNHVKVVIGGDGGDELFGGYDRYYGNLYASHYGKVPETLRRKVLAPAMALIPESGWYKSVGHQLRWLHHLSFHAGGARYASISIASAVPRCSRHRYASGGSSSMPKRRFARRTKHRRVDRWTRCSMPTVWCACRIIQS
jgi:asparagine synthase (glutamine-hydrolysing)